MKEIKTVDGLVSCVVPCYNSGEYIFECLESVKNQTYQNIELLLVDDGSDDDTLEVIREFEKKYKNRFFDIGVRKHINNKGICAAINTALPLVHGEYIMWFDSDDLLAENDISHKVQFLKENPEIQCVMAEADIFYDRNINESIGKLGNRPPVGNWFESYLLRYCNMSAGLNLTYTNTLFQVLPDDGLKEYATEQNWYMMMLLASGANIGHLDETLYYYRIREDSGSHRVSRSSGIEKKKYWNEVDRILEVAIIDSKFSYAYKCRCFDLQLKDSIVGRMSTIDDEQYDKDRDYVDYITNFFFEIGRVKENINNRKVFLWGASEKQKELKKVLEHYIKIDGLIDSNKSDLENQVIKGEEINSKDIYIIVSLFYHEQIIKLLNEHNYKQYDDYFYPKAFLYENVRDFKNVNVKKL